MSMTQPTTSEAESSLAAKCLDFCQALIRQGKNFNFNLNLGSTFTFALDTRGKSSPPEIVRKKLSPSAIRRNSKRKEDYLKRKSNPLETAEVDLETSGHDDDPFQRDQYYYRAKCKLNLSNHIRKSHKVNPQIDCLEDVKTFEVKSVQTGVTVKWGEIDTLTPPPGTVVLRYEPDLYEETKVKDLPLDYLVMSSYGLLFVHAEFLGQRCL